MAEDISTPRINAAYLDAFQNQTVRIVGRVTQLRGERATIEAGGNITAILSRVCSFYINQLVVPTSSLHYIRSFFDMSLSSMIPGKGKGKGKIYKQ